MFALQHYTFYDFIVNKSRGKSGPLFKFDAQEDVRLVSDATVEKDEVCVGRDGGGTTQPSLTRGNTTDARRQDCDTQLVRAE